MALHMMTERMKPEAPSSAPATIRLCFEDEAKQRCGEARIGVQKRNDRGHVRAADGSDQHDAENQRDADHDRKEKRHLGMNDESDDQSKRGRENGQADIVLTFISDGTLRQNFLQFAGGDQAASKGQRADNHFQPDFRHLESRHGGSSDVIFRDANQRRRKRAKCVAQRGPLRNRGHLHHAQGHADGGADDQRDDDPLVLADLRIAQSGDDSDAEAISPTKTPRLAVTGEPSHLIDRMKPIGRDDVRESMSCCGRRGHGFFAALPVLNMPACGR